MDTGQTGEQRAARVEQLTHIGSWEWNPATNTVWWSDELYRIYGLEPRSVTITLDGFLQRVHAEDRQNTLRQVQAAVARCGRFAYPERIVRPDGSIRSLETVGEVLAGTDGKPALVVGTCRDVTEKVRAERQKQVEQEILESVVTETPLPEILDRICLLIEEHSPGTLASILLVNGDGARLRHGAAPSLPPDYVRAIDGTSLGPRAGSCGTAAFLKAPVYVVDIESDPLWDDFRELARGARLRACWSTPFFAADGRVLGTFALYYREPRSPTPADILLAERASHLAGVAVQNRQLQAQVRAVSQHMDTVREEERAAIAREIHDQLGQTLTALKMDVALLGRRAAASQPISNELVAELVQGMASTLDELLAQIRHISAELRPPMLDDLGLTAAMEWQAREFERRTGIACAVSSSLGDAPVARTVATAVFRIFQEALTNVTRHAEAHRVDVELSRSGDWLTVQIRDDGKGISPKVISHPRSLGLLGIRERAMRLGGVAAIGPRKERGTTLLLRVPLTEVPELLRAT